LKIRSYKKLESTQKYLKELLKRQEEQAPICVTTEIQTHGVGSRNNEWRGLEGNLFVSFALPLDSLPNDLKVESASIYFSFLLKETLEEFGSKVWLKWPNDFYIKNKKIGGMITNIVDKDIVCGFGLNLQNAPEGFRVLDISIKKSILLEKYFSNLAKNFLWKQVFSKYRLEFWRNKDFFTHIKGQKVSFSEAVLQNDGSLQVNGERIFSLR